DPPCRSARAPQLHRRGRRRAQAPQTQGQSGAQAHRTADEPRPPHRSEERTQSAAGTLGRQAEAAAKAATVQATLRDATARLLADDAVRMQSSLASTTEGEDHGDRIADLDHRRTRAEARLNEIETRLSSLDAELDAQRAAESRTQTQIVRAQGLAQRAEDKRSHLLSEVTSLGRRESKSPEELRAQAE